MDKQHPRTCELHRLQRLDMSWWRNNYWRRLELHTLEVLQTPSVGEVCEYPNVSSFLNSYLGIGIGVCPRILLYKKIKKIRGVAMVTMLSLHQRNIVVRTLNVLLLTLNKALPGGRPRITRFVLKLISVWIKLNHTSCFLCLFLYALVWMYDAANTFIGVLNQAWCLGSNVFFGQTDMVSSLIDERQS